MLVRLLILAVVLASGVACNRTSAPAKNGPEPEVRGNRSIPFGTKEPETFAATLTITAFPEGKSRSKKYFVARTGSASLESFRVGEPDEFSVLTTEKGEFFRLNVSEKTARRLKRTSLMSELDSLTRSYTNRWLYEKKLARFVDRGEVEGLKKYEVIFEDETASRIYVFVDQKLDYPVKQEFYSVSDGKEALTLKVEFTEITTDPDPKLFTIPEGFSLIEATVN